MISENIREKSIFVLCFVMSVNAYVSPCFSHEGNVSKIVKQNPPQGALDQIQFAKSRDARLIGRAPELDVETIQMEWSSLFKESKEARSSTNGKNNNDYVVGVYTVGYFLSTWIRVFQIGPKPHEFRVAYDLPFHIDGALNGQKHYSFTPNDYLPVMSRDVDGDGIPELIVTTQSERGNYNGRWVFRWDGSKLQTMTPYDPQKKSRAGALAKIRDAYLEDLTGTGKTDLVSVVSSSKYGNTDGTFPNDLLEVYRIVGTQYQHVKDIYYFRTFAPGEPTGYGDHPDDDFKLGDSSKSYLVTVILGHPSEKDSPIELVVNGKSVSSSPIRVTNKPQSFPITVSRDENGSNSILVKLLYKHKGRVAVFVEEKK